MTAQKRGLLKGLMIAGLIALAGAIAILVMRAGTAGAPTGQNQALVGGPFTLVDQDGKTVTEKAFRGRYMMIYFGYTFCPDVCPTELAAMSDGLAALEKSDPGTAAKVEPVFITIDPARDTVPVMKEYVANFHPRLKGLTGTEAQVRAATSAWRVYGKKAGEGPDYLMDHSSMIFLMGPDGGYAAVFATGTSPADIAKGLKQYVH